MRIGEYKGSIFKRIYILFFDEGPVVKTPLWIRCSGIVGRVHSGGRGEVTQTKIKIKKNLSRRKSNGFHQMGKTS